MMYTVPVFADTYKCVSEVAKLKIPSGKVVSALLPIHLIKLASRSFSIFSREE